MTGGAGFIGSHLVDYLLATGETQVCILDNFSRGRLSNLTQHRDNPSLHLIVGDIRDVAAVEQAMQEARVVFHLAAQEPHPSATQEFDDLVASNVIGTLNVLRSAAKHSVERLIFASSRHVYGEPLELPVDEDAPLLAITAYGATKLAGEAFCRAFRREFGLSTIVLRLASVYGPRDSESVIPALIGCAREGQDMHVRGGNQVMDFVWIEQAVQALVRAAHADMALPPINIGTGSGTRILDVARRINRLADRRCRVVMDSSRPAETTRFVARVDRMRQMLRIEPPLDPLQYLPNLLSDSSAAGLTTPLAAAS